jgi:UDP-N-acetylmuramyl pentapeptide synthase
MNIKEASKILVLDPIHGAEVIAEELNELGKEVEIFNPYRETFLDQTFFKGLNLDLVIAPVHLSPNFEIVKNALAKNIPFMTHHEAVNEIAAIKNLFDGIKVIEVTGTIGKTSTCELIYQLVKNKSVLLHTSSSTRFISPDDKPLQGLRVSPSGKPFQGFRGRGRSPRCGGTGGARDGAEPHTQIFPRLGGTPANVLKVMELARGRNLKPDIAVFEVSLGLTGIGDVGVITSVKEDYRIAGGTKDASAVKKASTTYSGGRSIILHPGLSLPLSNGRENIFGDKDTNLWVEVEKSEVVYKQLRTITGDFISGEIAFKPFDSYMSTEFYRDPLEAAFCAVLSLGIAPEEINIDVSPVVGRMKLEKIKGRFLIDNSNSGTKLKFLGEIAEMARRLSESGKIILIIGAESEYVCEGVDLEDLKKVVEQRASDFHEIIIVGEEFKQKIEGRNVLFSPHLNAALERAIGDSEEGFAIISNVKTWR